MRELLKTASAIHASEAFALAQKIYVGAKKLRVEEITKALVTLGFVTLPSEEEHKK